jgi:translation initiation factor IF-2
MPSPKKTEKPAKTAATSTLTTRPPVVVVMGHIDHGKSTLLDYIRKSNIVAGEAGGITQHMGAYEVMHASGGGKAPTGKITFIDTPGHEAFGSIRTRGAEVADIAILVVSAEDGVKPQTLEALKAIQSAKLPYIVAINKIDKPEANIERTKLNLSENEIYLEGYGGDISFVPISALTGAGVPELLDLINLTAEMNEMKADESVLATGAVIEADLDSRKGISGTLLIKNGHLETGMFIVAENTYAPVRILEDFTGKPIKYATFSSPVSVVGFNTIPPVGAKFVTVVNKKEAEQMAAEYKPSATTTSSASSARAASPTRAGQKTADTSGRIVVPFIIKADAVGSLDGIHHEFAKINQEKVLIKIVTEGIGNVSETDVKTAQSHPEIIILAFNAAPDAKAQSLLERSTVNIREFSIIYELIQFVKETVAAKVPKEYVEESIGKAKILAIFSKNKDKQIIGGKVQEGSIALGADVKVLRRDAEIGRGKVKELQQQKAKSEEVATGYEFGALVDSKIELAIGDKIEAFKTVEKKA